MISKSVPARAIPGASRSASTTSRSTPTARLCKAGRSFEDGVGYASAPKKPSWVQLRGVTSVETAAIEMEAVAALSRRCRDPVYHLIIAYAKDEHPTREQVVSDAERLLKAIGMEKSQYVLAAHKDTDNYHAHVIANRIGPERQGERPVAGADQTRARLRGDCGRARVGDRRRPSQPRHRPTCACTCMRRRRTRSDA